MKQNPKPVTTAQVKSTKKPKAASKNVLNQYFNTVEHFYVPYNSNTKSFVAQDEILNLLDKLESRKKSFKERIEAVNDFVSSLAKDGGFMLPDNFSAMLQCLVNLQRKTKDPLCIMYSGKDHIHGHRFDIIEMKGRLVQSAKGVTIKPNRGGKSIKLDVATEPDHRDAKSDKLAALADAAFKTLVDTKPKISKNKA